MDLAQRMLEVRFAIQAKRDSGILRSISHINRKGREALCGEQAVLWVESHSACKMCNLIQELVKNGPKQREERGFVDGIPIL